MSPRHGTLQFGDFVLDAASGKLTRSGRQIKIQPQPFLVLRILAERQGDIVSRDELRSRLWGNSTHVAFDQGLNYCVRQIRLALKDNAAQPEYLETLPKQGYRFIAPVEIDQTEEAPSSAITEPPPSPPVGALSRTMPSRKLILALTAAAVVLFIAGLLGSTSRKVTSPRSYGNLAVTKLTYLPGDETDPAFSPDGRTVAFAWNGPAQDNYNIYLIDVGSGSPRRLTQSSNKEMSPVWSPDGSQIAFLRLTSTTKASLIVIPSRGGPEHELREVSLFESVYRAMRPMLAWAPDGIVYAAMDPESGRSALYRMDLGSDSSRKLFDPDGEKTLGNASPAFSPDGKWLAYSEVNGPFQSRLFVRPVTPGMKFSEPPILVSKGEDSVAGSPVWAPHEPKLLFSEGNSLFEWTSSMGTTQVYSSAVALSGMSATWTSEGNLRVVVGQSSQPEFHRVAHDPSGLRTTGEPADFAPVSAGQGSGQFSPDGKSFVFVSGRSGATEVWMTDADGRNLRQLTHLNSKVIGYPSWSRDSDRIAFHSWTADKPQIDTLDVGANGALKKLTDSAFGFFMDSWSADGKYIYATRSTGKPRPFRIPVKAALPRIYST